jgi:hypothetical protein
MATLYFNGAVDSEWTELDNWWTDATFTTPATSLPSSSDNVIASASIASNSGSEPTVANLTVQNYSSLGIIITVTGMATFNENSRLEGTITGDCTFNHTSRHDSVGNIIGNCIFNDNAIFKGDTSNNIVSGSITFNNNSQNITNIAADNIIVNRKILGIANSDILGMYPNLTTLLLHFDGANNATTFADSSVNNYSVTRGGSATISTAQSKFGGSSLLLNGTDEYLRVEGFSSLDFTAGDWTVEAWIYPTDVTGGERAVLSLWDDSLADFILGIDDGEVWLGSNYLSATDARGGSVSANQWYHIAATRSGNTGRIFLDGAIVGTVDLEGDSTQGPGSSLQIGKIGVGYSAYWFKGYIDEMRIVKGAALYTANFTPPTAPY